MPTTTCDAAALVPATATTQAHVHQCNRQLAVGFPHLGQHHCGECRTSFTIGPASWPTASAKCEACGAIQPMANLREMHPEPDVTQHVCLDIEACSARVAGRQQTNGHWLPDETWATAPLVEPAPALDSAQAVDGLQHAVGLVKGMRDVVDDMPRGTVGRTTLQRHLAQLERQLIDYRPPVGELAELVVEPGVVDQVNDLGKRVVELERAVANLIEQLPRPLLHVTPPYVHRLLDAYLTGHPLDFRGEPVPLDVQRRLENEPSWRRFTAVRTRDGHLYAPRDIELVYEP